MKVTEDSLGMFKWLIRITSLVPLKIKQALRDKTEVAPRGVGTSSRKTVFSPRYAGGLMEKGPNWSVGSRVGPGSANPQAHQVVLGPLEKVGAIHKPQGSTPSEESRKHQYWIIVIKDPPVGQLVLKGPGLADRA